MSWFDNTLLHILYGVHDKQPADGNWPLQITRFVIEGINPSKMLVDLTIGLCYLLVPSVWLTVAGWASVQVGYGFAGFQAAQQANQSHPRAAWGTVKQLGRAAPTILRRLRGTDEQSGANK